MKTSIDKITIALAFIFLTGYFLTPRVAFDDLEFVSGSMIGVERKKTAGFTMEVSSSNGKNYIFNIPNSTKETNSQIYSIEMGSLVGVWFDSRYALKNGSYDAWQLDNDSEILIGYAETANTSAIYSKIFLGLFVLLLCVFFFLFYSRRSKRI